MFDFIAFIRQMLPPQLRQPVTIGLIRVLYFPILSVFNAVQDARSNVLTSAISTGQVAVLEALLNQAISASGAGSIYLLEGDQVIYDFQVLVPPNLSPDLIKTLDAIIKAHKLAGKRYSLQAQVGYQTDVPVVGPTLSWATSYPYFKDGVIHFAINERGTFRVKLTTGDVVLYNTDFSFAGATNEQTFQGLDPSASYTLTISNLVVTLTQATSPVTPTGLTKMGYSRDATTHETTLWFTSGTVYKVLNSLVSGSAQGDGWQTDTARLMDGISLRDYNRGLRFNPTTRGVGGILSATTYYILISNQDGTNPVTYAWPVQAGDTNGVIDIPLIPTSKPLPMPNRAPVVAGLVAQQTVTAYGAGFTVPVNTFTDPDGDVLTLSLGVLAGFGFDATNRRVTIDDGLANGTYTLTLTATDPGGLSVATSVKVVVNRTPVVAPAPGTATIVYADFNAGGGVTKMLQLRQVWETDPDGSKWSRFYDDATPPLYDPYHKYYLFDEDGVPNKSKGVNPYEGPLQNFGRFPENYMLTIQVVIAKGPDFFDLVGQNNGYKLSNGAAVIYTGTKP